MIDVIDAIALLSADVVGWTNANRDAAIALRDVMVNVGAIDVLTLARIFARFEARAVHWVGISRDGVISGARTGRLLSAEAVWKRAVDPV